MQKQVDNIEAKVDEMYKSIVGSELNPNGLIKRVKTIEDYQNKDKKQKWMVAGGFAVLGLLSKFWDKITHLI